MQKYNSKMKEMGKIIIFLIYFLNIQISKSNFHQRFNEPADQCILIFSIFITPMKNLEVMGQDEQYFLTKMAIKNYIMIIQNILQTREANYILGHDPKNSSYI